MSRSTAERKNGGFAGSGRWARIAIRYVGLILGPVLGLACFAASAQAEVPIISFSATPSTTQAGGHPDLVTEFKFKNRDLQNFPTSCFCQDAENITTHLPTGVIGNPHATPQCTAVELGEHTCPPDSQVGVVHSILFNSYFPAALYNLVPHVEQAGLLGFYIPFTSTPAFIVLSARTNSDYGLDATIAGLEHAIPPEGVRIALWGVPDSSSHDAERAPFNSQGKDQTCGNYYPPSPDTWPCFSPTPSSSPAIPFLDGPTTCTGPLPVSLEILGYDLSVTQDEQTYPATTGCDQLSFNPSLYAQPTTTQADSASGLAVDLSVPQEQSASSPSPSEIRALTVTLPRGFSINPNAADGKTSCTNAEARLGTMEAALCPEFSKVGSVTLTSSALPGPIPGYIYLGTPEPNDRYRLILTADGFATHVKLIGSVYPDPQTGQLTVSFENLPQSPFSEFNLHFFGSERGLLATPTQCGTFPVTSTFMPWDAQLSDQTSVQYFTLESGPDETPCPGPRRPFDPSFTASALNSTGGAHSPFTVEIARKDGDQNLSVVKVTTPPGFAAKLAGTEYCSDSALAKAASTGYTGREEESAPVCPGSSLIGTAATGAGAGTHPVYLEGRVYLAGPYNGAPLSLAVITPAISGPYDLGNVVVRAALDVNPETAQITAISDPLPRILDGVPLRLRSLQIDLNRPGFTLNPTNCNPLSVDAELVGEEGSLASPSEHFQATNCFTLPFAPKLTLKLSGSTKHSGNPALSANLSAKPGEANIASTAVTLPQSELIDNAHIKDPCTRVQFAANKCPAGSIIGTAMAETPLLEKPLEGPVYLRSAPENKSGLPDVVAALDGQIDIDLDGKIETIDGHLRTSFKTVPDAPISRFNLRLDGGKKGLLVNSANICKAPLGALAQIDGQNGTRDNQNQNLATPCRANTAERHLKRARVVGQ